jgi:hypothetical protein
MRVDLTSAVLASMMAMIAQYLLCGGGIAFTSLEPAVQPEHVHAAKSERDINEQQRRSAQKFAQIGLPSDEEQQPDEVRRSSETLIETDLVMLCGEKLPPESAWTTRGVEIHVRAHYDGQQPEREHQWKYVVSFRNGGLDTVQMLTRHWIFINEDPDALGLLESLGPLGGELRQFDLDNLMLVHSRSYDVPCNVKVMLDVFLEVYHLKSIHQDTADRFLDHRGMTATLWPHGHSRMVTPNRRPDWIDPGTRGLPAISSVTEIPRINNVSYNIFPNIVMPPTATGIPMLVFWPQSASTMRIECHWFGPKLPTEDLSPLWDTRIKNFETILLEDLRFAGKIQESVEGPGFIGAPLNYQERRIYHWHEEADRRIGPERVPAHMRVEPMLGDWIEKL